MRTVASVISNWRLYTTGESLYEILCSQSRHYNTPDFYLKYNTSAHVLTSSYLQRRTQLAYNTQERVYSLRSRNTNNWDPTAKSQSDAIQSIIYIQAKVYGSQVERKEFKYKQFILLRHILHHLMLSTKRYPQSIYIRAPGILCSMLFVPPLYILKYRTRTLVLSTPTPHFLHLRCGRA